MRREEKLDLVRYRCIDMRVDDFLNKLPRKLLKMDVQLIFAKYPGSARPVRRGAQPSDAFATIQVRAFNGAPLRAELWEGATVADRIASTPRRIAGALRDPTAFPPRLARDDAATLEAGGLVPTAVVVLQKVRRYVVVPACPRRGSRLSYSHAGTSRRDGTCPNLDAASPESGV